jgi:hypothetical protein
MATFEQRRRAIRHHRASARAHGATQMVAWVGAFGALVLVLLGGVFSLR